MQFFVVLFIGFFVYMHPEVLLFPAIILALIVLFFRFKATKQKKSNPVINNNYKKIWQKGVDGENEFKAFLREVKTPFIAVEQSKYTKYSGFKRPDFILGDEQSFRHPIAFEVKNHEISHHLKYPCYVLNNKELKGLEGFSDFMQMPVCFAFKSENEWMFISLNDFTEYSFFNDEKRYVSLKRFESIKNKINFDNFINGFNCD